MIVSDMLKAVSTLSFAIFFSLSHPAFALEMAITLDDLPAHEIKPEKITRMEIVSKISAVFHKHQIQNVYGFMNGVMLEYHPELYGVMEEWVRNGFRLGNHTYSHMNLVNNSAASFNKDIELNEKLLEQLDKKEGPSFFRYPYLYEGDTLPKRNVVRRFLKAKGYEIAQVTIDFDDWAWNAPYTRCLKNKDNQAIQWMKREYLSSVMEQTRYSQGLAKRLFGRDIKHILLLHAGVFTGKILDDLLSILKKKEIRFISLQEASEDPIYKTNPNVPFGEESLPFIVQWARSKGLDTSKRPKSLKAKLQQLCLN